MRGKNLSLTMRNEPGQVLAARRRAYIRGYLDMELAWPLEESRVSGFLFPSTSEGHDIAIFPYSHINLDSSDIWSDDYNLPQIAQMTRIFCLNTGYAHRFSVAGFAARLHR